MATNGCLNQCLFRSQEHERLWYASDGIYHSSSQHSLQRIHRMSSSINYRVQRKLALLRHRIYHSSQHTKLAEAVHKLYVTHLRQSLEEKLFLFAFEYPTRLDLLYAHTLSKGDWYLCVRSRYMTIRTCRNVCFDLIVVGIRDAGAARFRTGKIFRGRIGSVC